ncbi:MAG: crossover junction endodeoxyribonuclease RuvC [Candidatus Nealsonbacteria bacterium]
MIIIGIDPGTANTGYGIIQTISKPKGDFECLDYGLIKTSPLLNPGERLKKIHSDLSVLLNKYKPAALAVEKIYFFKNLKTAMPVSQAKGVILLTAAKKRVPVYEFTPLQVKMGIVGYGKAEKKQVQKMIKLLLRLEEIPKPDDAADALGLAVCCAGIIKSHRGS